MATFSLGKYFQPKTAKTPMITITGDSGIGKTSLAATFPNPLIVRVEDGTESIKHLDYMQLEMVTDFAPEHLAARGDLSNIFKQLLAVYHAADLPEKTTLVIDSLTTLEQKIAEDIVLRDPKAKSLAEAAGGFGKGYVELARRMRAVFELCQKIADERGFPIVFIAHAKTEKISPPDGEEYTRYSLQLHKDVRAPFCNEVDLLGYLTEEYFMKGGESEKRKAISSGERILRCHTSIISDAKNRYGITGNVPVPYGHNPLLELIPFFSEYATEAPPSAEEAQAAEFSDEGREGEEPSEPAPEEDEKPAPRKTKKKATTTTEDQE